MVKVSTAETTNPGWRGRSLALGLVLVGLEPEHVVALQVADQALDGGTRAFAPAAQFAKPDQPVIGLDAQDGGVESACLPEIAPVLATHFDRCSNPPGLDVPDAHCLPS